MRIRVIDGVPHTDDVPYESIALGGLDPWRPLDGRNEDREAVEVFIEHMVDKSKPIPVVTNMPDGLYELVEEHRPICPLNNPDCAMMVCVCEGEWPRKTLRRVDDA